MRYLLRSEPWIALAGHEAQSHGPSTVSTRWPALSSGKTCTFPCRMKKILSTSYRGIVGRDPTTKAKERT
jgi:hypothetical protein